MATNYPDGFDAFIEPTLPEDTPLSQAGSGDRNHTEHHRDLGDAIEAVQAGAAYKDHDHSGNAANIRKGGKLKQINTHQEVDTNTSAAAIHHTLGLTAFQAAAGNHAHDFHGGSITNRSFIRCTSTTRPTGAERVKGLLIMESNTLKVKYWDGNSWEDLISGETATTTTSANPHCELVQNSAQTLSYPAATQLSWHTAIQNNPSNMWVGGGPIHIQRNGTYQISCTVHWDPNIVPDQATLQIVKNGSAIMSDSAYMRGGLYSPGFSQTLSCTGSSYCTQGQDIWAEASYTAPGSIIGRVATYIDNSLGGSAGKSRINVTWTSG